MFESYKLKKAKAKLELNAVKKQLNEIEAQREKERWERMPQWEKNIETEILLDKMGVSGENKEHSSKYAAIMAGIWTLFIFGIIYAAIILLMPPSAPVAIHQIHQPILNKVLMKVSNNRGVILSAGILNLIMIVYVYIEIYYIYRRGYGH